MLFSLKFPLIYSDKYFVNEIKTKGKTTMKHLLLALSFLAYGCSSDDSATDAAPAVVEESAAIVHTPPETSAVEVSGTCAELNKFERREIYLIAGQSNAGFFAPYLSRTAYSDRVLMSEDAINCFTSKDAMPWVKSHNGGVGGSVWNFFADERIASGKTDQIILINIAVGGSPIQDWSAGGRWLTSLMETAKSMRDLGMTPTAILWAQGEANNAGTLRPTTSDEYYGHLTTIVSALRGENISSPFYAAFSTVCETRGPSAEIRDAITRSVDAGLDIRLGPDTDVLGPELRDEINCHFNGDGLKVAAGLWNEALNK